MMEAQAYLDDIARRDQDIRAWSWLSTCTPEPVSEAAGPVSDAAGPVPGTVRAGPLAGLRFGVKDVIDVRGMPTCHGAALTDMPPARFDAACVAMLRARGALPVGKTVTAEFAVTAPGPTRNPWNTAHTPGGSSSGSAAAVAAGMVPLALGTQTGGSIIRPAAFNGVVGFKPTFGRVPRTGMNVLSDSLDTIGWFTPDVTLSRHVAEVFMGPQAVSAEGIASPATPEKLKVAVLPSLEAGPLSEGAMATLKRAAEDLANHGAQVEWLEDRELIAGALAAHAGIMGHEVSRGLLAVMQGEAGALRPQTLDFIRNGLEISAEEYLRQQERRLKLQEAWQQRISGYDFILTPSAPGAAPQGLSSTGSSIFNRTWSLLGWPCVHLPLADDDGLPVGVQCVGRPLGDLALLSLAEMLHPLLDRRKVTRPS